MGKIGEERRHITVEPVPETLPAPAPEPEPAPEREPEKVG